MTHKGKPGETHQDATLVIAADEVTAASQYVFNNPNRSEIAVRHEEKKMKEGGKPAATSSIVQQLVEKIDFIAPLLDNTQIPTDFWALDTETALAHDATDVYEWTWMRCSVVNGRVKVDESKTVIWRSSPKMKVEECTLKDWAKTAVELLSGKLGDSETIPSTEMLIQ